MMSCNSFRALAALIVSATLAACGGGDGYGGSDGGGGNPPPTPQPGSLQFPPGEVSVDEQAGTVQLTITRTGGSDGAVSVRVGSGGAGSAIAGQDYTAINTTVSFAAGDAAAKTVTVSITDDAQAEADESFLVSLEAPTGGAQLGGKSTAIVTIRDNDPVPVAPPAAPTVAVSAAIKQLTFTWASVPEATSYRLLQNPDGASGFTQVGAAYPGDAVSASIEVAVHRHDWVNALYSVEACKAGVCSGSTSVSAVDAMLQAIGYFKASNTGVNDRFGFSVALSADGSTLAVGAPLEDSNAKGVEGADQSNNDADFAGAVYVFTRAGALWSQQAYVKASNTQAVDQFGTQAADQFGFSVALSADGSTLAVGAIGEDSNAKGVGAEQEQANNDASSAGAVYVFTRAGAQWSQQAYVKASNTDAGDFFGSALALSADGSTLAVGAIGEASNATGVEGADQSNNSVDFAGAVYVFTRAGVEWSQQAYVKASNTEEFDQFGGTALALSADGSTLAVGAFFEDSSAIGVNNDQLNNDADAAGAVYVFTRDGPEWSQQAYVKASNTDATDFFGNALALSANGNTLAVGAPLEDSDAKGVGAEQVPANNVAPKAGAVYVFTRAGALWSQQAYVKASNTGAGDNFGAALALSADGSTLAVGARFEQSSATGVDAEQEPANNAALDAGAVYVFTRGETLWSQQSYVKASNTGEEDNFGTAVALSGDGRTLAVGAIGEASSAEGVSGAGQDKNDAAFSGAAYVF